MLPLKIKAQRTAFYIRDKMLSLVTRPEVNEGKIWSQLRKITYVQSCSSIVSYIQTFGKVLEEESPSLLVGQSA